MTCPLGYKAVPTKDAVGTFNLIDWSDPPWNTSKPDLTLCCFSVCKVRATAELAGGQEAGDHAL